MKKNLVSIIIPFYNAEKFISDTLKSILSQSNVLFEIIAVDDGSSDLSSKIIESFRDERIQYYYQENKGVSLARNYGLTKAKGEYVIFFDSDDLMTENYIESRLNQLILSNSNFISGKVRKYIGNVIFSDFYRGTSDNLEREILFFDKDVITCPSNYLFNKSFLIDNNLFFNSKLSSTADKFFLLECSKKGIGIYSDSVSDLIYRVSENSMSNKFTDKLVKDNELYYLELKRIDLIPKEIYFESLFRGYYMLAGSYKIVGNYTKMFFYLFKSIIYCPKCIVTKLIFLKIDTQIIKFVFNLNLGTFTIGILSIYEVF